MTDIKPKYRWVGISIVAMWLAVLFVGIFGGSYRMERTTGLGGSTIMEFPVVLIVAACAVVATIAVGRRGFRE
jgi:hypothetical protein